MPSAKPRCSAREPARHRPSGRGVDARAERAREGSRTTRHGELGRVAPPPCQTPRRRPRARRLAVTRSPTRSAAIPQGRNVSMAPTPATAEQHADLGEAQVVTVAEHGREHRQPESGRAETLARRPGREHDPARRASGAPQRVLVPARAALEAALRVEERSTSAARSSTDVSVSQGTTVPSEIRARKSCSTGAKPWTYGCWSTTNSSVPVGDQVEVAWQEVEAAAVHALRPQAEPLDHAAAASVPAPSTANRPRTPAGSRAPSRPGALLLRASPLRRTTVPRGGLTRAREPGDARPRGAARSTACACSGVKMSDAAAGASRAISAPTSAARHVWVLADVRNGASPEPASRR